ncbi:MULTISPECIES: hypothetical protein [unclassified Pseudomonas]|uniref:hypothetical protein n=1 Tax=unclassified Pseudomonas TaxID=196821 RepID=UPI00147344F9|nr:MULTISPECIES: hypothetical protein [unclassified Pseudomonas]NMX94286.1 hypothetical protein [Pseudomonas sp. WS 5086]NMY48132.1 hypothetical protein [Pseudomonas sp. WS 5027]
MSAKDKIKKTDLSDALIRSVNFQAGVSGWELTPDGSFRIYDKQIKQCRSA